MRCRAVRSKHFVQSTLSFGFEVMGSFHALPYGTHEVLNWINLMVLVAGKELDLSRTAMMCCLPGMGPNKSTLISLHASSDVFFFGRNGSPVVLLVNMVHSFHPAMVD